MQQGITSVPREALSPPLQEMWDFVQELTGQARYVEKGAHAPELIDFAMNGFYKKIFFAGRVETRIKELARLRMSLGHGCRSCNLANTTTTRAAGYSQAQIEAIEGDRSLFDAREQAVLELADQFLLTNPRGHLEPDLYARLRAHFDDAQILELGTVMSYLGGLAKMLFVFDMAEKEETCPFRPASDLSVAAE